MLLINILETREFCTKGLLIHSGEANIIDASVVEAKQSRAKKDNQGNNAADGSYNVIML